MNFEIRQMQAEDAQAVLQIFQEGIDSQNATFDKEIPTWEAWDTKHFNLCRWILEDENKKIAGWAAIQPISNRDCFKGVAEVSIYLTKNAQGKGLGKVLLQKLILDSEDKNFWTLQSGIFPENQASIHVHEQLGFRLVGRREKLAQMQGKWRDIVLLERRSTKIGV